MQISWNYTFHKWQYKSAQFTDPTPTNYWYAKRVKLTFLNVPILNTI